MRLKKSDVIFLVGIAAVLALFIVISGKEKTKLTPKDEQHQTFYDMYEKGTAKIDIDGKCPECHDGTTIPFPENHPPKPGDGVMRCLFCHKLQAP